MPLTPARCCIVGAGPAGAMLAFLLARQGIPVTLLEAHLDFDREFRGDTLHPSALEILDSLGLADRLLQLPHTRVQKISIQTPSGSFAPFDLSTLRSKFNYIALMPQAAFLEFLTHEASQLPSFDLRMGVRVEDLIREHGVVRGVITTRGGERETIEADLTIGCDGRNSRIRHVSGLQETMLKTSPPMDVLWFKLPRLPSDTLSISGRIQGGHMIVTLPRTDHYQLGYVLLKGTFHELKEAGLDQFQQTVAQLRPELADRVETLQSWKDVSLLSVESTYCQTWHQPGLLLLGDAAHVMSPVGGVGINYAIQDAVVAANRLCRPLRSGQVSVADLAKVQSDRRWPTRFIQWFQGQVQNRIIRQALDPRVKFQVPWFLKLPILRHLPVRILAYGLKRVRVEGEASRQ